MLVCSRILYTYTDCRCKNNMHFQCISQTLTSSQVQQTRYRLILISLNVQSIQNDWANSLIKKLVWIGIGISETMIYSFSYIWTSICNDLRFLNYEKELLKTSIIAYSIITCKYWIIIMGIFNIINEANNDVYLCVRY